VAFFLAMSKIKFNHVQDLSDARFAASAMAEWIGFSIVGPHAMNADAIQEIISWCSGPKLILEVGDASIDKINSFLDVLPVNGIECNADRITELNNALPDVAEWIVLGDGPSSHPTHSAQWHPQNHITEINLSAANVARILGNKPYGFSLNCEKETEIGKKDLSLWHDFFEALDLY
jgi:hypothetical protein